MLKLQFLHIICHNSDMLWIDRILITNFDALIIIYS